MYVEWKIDQELVINFPHSQEEVKVVDIDFSDKKCPVVTLLDKQGEAYRFYLKEQSGQFLWTGPARNGYNGTLCLPSKAAALRARAELAIYLQVHNAIQNLLYPQREDESIMALREYLRNLKEKVEAPNVTDHNNCPEFHKLREMMSIGVAAIRDSMIAKMKQDLSE